MYWILNTRTRAQVLSAIGRWAQEGSTSSSFSTSSHLRALRTSIPALATRPYLQKRDGDAAFRAGPWTTKGVVNTVNLFPPELEILYFGRRGMKHDKHMGGYSNFGHKPIPPSAFTSGILWFIIISMILLRVDWEYLFDKYDIEFPRVDAASPPEPSKKDKVAVGDESEHEDSSSEGGKELSKKKSAKVGFRDRKIIEYENRIRQYSTPDKTFRYFASLQVVHVNGETEIFMTPDDFLRSITPGIKQPDGLGLDQFKRYDPKQAGKLLELDLHRDSIFYKLGSAGLISFSDYVFLLTVLSTSRRHFEIAFRMFDLNGDGDVDVEEFEKVTALIRQRTSIGARHREHSVSVNSLREMNSALNSYFFGTTRREKLTIEKFLEFQMQLQTEILKLEFKRKEPNDNGKINETDFAELLLAYAGYPPKKKARMLKRVKRKCKDKEYATGVSLDDYQKFFHLLSNINDVDTALTFYHIAGAAIDQSTLKHVARTVAHVELSDHIVDVVFTLFDENMDGQLSNREFVAVMKNRLMRGLEKPKDTGFFKLLRSTGRCAKESLPF
ncbi:calcium uptake protein 1 homolog, mitochondrial isoform X2 [Folsomia candida]|uniref:Calcium uptake protein 1, mitochondrial n=1 Tax=Folsomia candida TaxID=158441 RepID=A0A226E757_FOLCA|nr:calcium uptake protein 1 homolog, mitochondrial isoform X2 [Folsomia candida]OXA52924.1 Calcium uptake protein 1, mitochondrial [Folsomia candida]